MNQQKILFTGLDHRGRNLRGADLQWRGLHGLDLRGADLRDANLRGASLVSADLRGADLRGANLRGADLWRTRFEGAELGETCLIPAGEPAGERMPKFDLRRWCQTLGGVRLDGKLVGFRSAKTVYHDEVEYSIGREYTAPVFSLDRSSECHPGLHFCHSANWLEYMHGVSVDAAIRVAVDPLDAIAAESTGSARHRLALARSVDPLDAIAAESTLAFRCRRFVVIGPARA